MAPISFKASPAGTTRQACQTNKDSRLEKALQPVSQVAGRTCKSSLYSLSHRCSTEFDSSKDLLARGPAEVELKPIKQSTQTSQTSIRHLASVCCITPTADLVDVAVVYPRVGVMKLPAPISDALDSAIESQVCRGCAGKQSSMLIKLKYGEKMPSCSWRFSSLHTCHTSQTVR